MHSIFRVLGTVFALALLGACSASSPAAAAKLQTVSKTLTSTQAVPGGASIRVENMLGDVRFSQGGTQLQVTATVVAGAADRAAAQALADSIQLTMQNEANQISLHVDYPVDAHDTYRYQSARPGASGTNGINVLGLHISGNFSGNSAFTYQGKAVRVTQGESAQGTPLQVNLAIQLPKGIRASVDNHVGTIDAADLANTLELHNDWGDMSTRHTAGNLSVETGSGDASIVDHTGNAAAHTGSGDLTLRQVTGDVDLHTGSGDIDVTELNARTITMKTGSGDLHLRQTTGDMDLHTGSGDITGNTVRASRIATRAGSGDIKLDDIKLDGTRSGTASGSLDVHTGSGNITLDRAVGLTTADVDSGSGDIHLSGDLSTLRTFDISAASGDITLASSKPPAVHLEIESPEIHANWAGISNTKTSERRFSGDLGAATATGSVRSASGSVTLTSPAD